MQPERFVPLAHQGRRYHSESGSHPLVPAVRTCGLVDSVPPQQGPI